jgi:hypothetical protein
MEALWAKVQKWADGFGKPRVSSGVNEDPIQRAMAAGLEQEAYCMKAHLNSEIEILKRERHDKRIIWSQASSRVREGSLLG